MEDSKIVDLYLNRDECAIKHTAEKYGSLLRSLSQNIVGDAETAKECENDTYMKTWQAIPPHEPRSYLFAFLAKITRQLSLDVCRNRSRLKREAYISELSSELEECLPTHGDGDITDNIALSEAINGFLKTLTKEQRSIFLRRYWFMDSVSSISSRFSISESKTKTTLFRLRNRFRSYLEQEGYTL